MPVSQQGVVDNEPDNEGIHGPSAGVSTDNAVPRWDGTDASTLQNSGVTIDDSNNVVTPADSSALTFTLSGTGGGKLTTFSFASVNTLMTGNVNDASASANMNLMTGASIWIVSRWGTGSSVDTYGRWSASGGLQLAANGPLSFMQGFVGGGATAVRIRSDGSTGISVDTGALGTATIKGPLATGSNSAANDLILGSGVSTGNATPGKLRLRGTAVGSSGSTAQTLADALVIHNDERVEIMASAIDFTALPTADPASAGRLWNDSGTVKISAG